MAEDNNNAGGTTTTTTTTGPAVTTPAATPAPAPAPENRVPQSVLDRVTAEKWDERRGREEAERQLSLANQTLEEMKRVAGTAAQPGSTQPSSAPATPAPATRQDRVSPEELQRLVLQQSEINDFNRRCNTAVEEGRAAHEDFDRVVIQDLTNRSPVYDPRAGKPILPQPLVEAALETGAAAEVLYALGKDPQAAERIMRLSPIRQAVEVAKFHAAMAAPSTEDDDDGTGDDGSSADDNRAARRAPARGAQVPNLSSAPAPVRVRAGSSGGAARGAFDLYDTSKSSTEDWIAQREADLARKRANGAGRR
jgi:hypothetical protein